MTPILLPMYDMFVLSFFHVISSFIIRAYLFAIIVLLSVQKLVLVALLHVISVVFMPPH